MPGFSISPAAPFPPQTGEPFPVGIQWQNDGENLGDRTVDTINIRTRLSASRGSGETANVVTIDGGTFTWRDVTDDDAVAESDLGNGLKVNTDGSSTLITVPGDDELGISATDGDVSLLIMQAGAGAVVVAGQSGVTVNVRSALSLTLAGQYAVISLIHTGPNEWVVCGDLATS